jgi:hypothetical protein
MKRKATIASIITLLSVIALVAGCGLWGKEDPIARGPQTKCYSTSGGDKWVCRSGGEFEILSGGILDIQAGATAVWAGDASFTGASSFTGAVSVAATPAATATPQVLISDVGAGVPLEVRNASATPEVVIDGGYELDMNANEIVNIGAAGTDFSGTGGLTTAAGIVVSAGGISATGSITVATGGANIAGEVEYGTNDLSILGYASAGEQLVVGTSSGVTATTVAAHGLTTVTFALCTLGEDPDTDAGDPVACSVTVAGDVVTVKLWQDDWTAGATAAVVHWLVVGTP